MKKVLIVASLLATTLLPAALEVDYMIHLFKKNQTHIIQQKALLDNPSLATKTQHKVYNAMVEVELINIINRTVELLFTLSYKQPEDDKLVSIASLTVMGQLDEEKVVEVPVFNNATVKSGTLWIKVTEKDELNQN